MMVTMREVSTGQRGKQDRAQRYRMKVAILIGDQLAGEFCVYDGRLVNLLTLCSLWAAIRGGIPLVFPQFGQPRKEMPSHGFARVSNWALSEETADDDQVKV
jgi:hypothetical protein